jgi:ATP-dependent DNA helicase RecQ
MSEARDRFGIDELRPGQAELLRAVLDGRDAIGILPTGAGKSLCFQLPALFLPKATVVVSPLLALMKDQTDRLTDVDVAVERIDSTLSVVEERDAAARIRAGEPELIYVTPERLENPEYVEVLSRRGVSLFVIDEAHCVSQWGHDFRPAYLQLRDAIRALGSPPVLAITATATPEVTEDLVRQLALRDPVIVRTGIDRDNLRFEVRRTVNDGVKREELERLLADEPGVGIIYLATTKAADELYAHLVARGESAGRYHGKLSSREREDTQAKFMAGELRVMVATKAFGMGIDKADLRFIVHWHFPDSLESYVQEAGRGGRDGLPARAVIFYRVEDRRIQSYFLGGKYPSRAECRLFYDAAVARAAAVSAGVSIDELGELAGLAPRRAKVVTALLENLGVAERRGGRVRVIHTFRDDDELERFLAEYETRHRGDRARLDAIVAYMQSMSCRGQRIQAYFGEQAVDPCGHCDNCESGAAARVASISSARGKSRRRDTPPLVALEALNVGDRVTHRRFGLGNVTAIDGQSVTVAFPLGERTVRAGWLSLATQPAPTGTVRGSAPVPAR